MNKRKYIIIGIVALILLIVGFGLTIGLSVKPNKVNNDKPSIEIPVEPPSPPNTPNIPVEPTNPEVPEESEKDDEESDDTDNGEDVDNSIDNNQDEDNQDEEENEIVGVEMPFTFENGVLTGYKGDETEITLPTSYNYAGYRTETTTFENLESLERWYHNQDFYFRNSRITINLANGEKLSIRDYIDLYRYYDRLEEIFPATYVEKIDIFVEGNDIAVNKIGSKAFENSQITKVIVPEGYVAIGNAAFCDSMLEEIVLPDSLNQLGGSCFSRTQIEQIILPEQISVLPAGCFDSCLNLKSIDLTNIVRIEDGAFWGCQGLQSVTFSNKLKHIAYTSFFVTTSLEVMDIPSSLETYICFWNCYEGLKSLILRPNFVFDLHYDYDELATHGAKIYVPDDLLEEYKTQYPELDLHAISEYE